MAGRGSPANGTGQSARPKRGCATASISTSKRPRAAKLEPIELLGRSTRQNLRRLLRKYETIETTWAETLDEADEIFSELVQLHQARWIASGQPGAFASERFEAFQRQLLVQGFVDQMVVLFRARHNGETVGCLMLLVDRGRLLDYLSGFASFEQKPSPGLVSHYLCLSQAAGRGYRAYDFLVGDKRHKDNLSTDVQQLAWATWRRRTLRNTAIDCLKAIKKLRPQKNPGVSASSPAAVETDSQGSTQEAASVSSESSPSTPTPVATALMTTATLTAPSRNAAGSESPAGSTRSRSATRPIHICHVSMTLRTGGLERLLVEFGRLANRDRYLLEFVSLTDAGPPAEDLRALGVHVRSLGFPKAGKREIYQSLKKLFRDRSIDIVHTHNTYPHFYATLAAVSARVPVIVNTQHGRGCGNGWKDHLQFAIANHFTDRVVGVSEDATKLCQQQNPASASKMVRLWNGIDVGRFKFTGPASQYTAVSVGRLSSEKDFATLVRAAAIVKTRVPEFRLLMVGDGAERPALESLSRELNLGETVTFLGERRDVPAILAQAGFYVASSRTEGISLTILEAMSVGLPVVTTAVGGSPEIVEEGVTGHLAPAQDPAALSDAIVRMCERRGEWRSIGAAGRTRVEQHFNVRTMINGYEHLYEELLANKGVRR
ncbi:MAG: GNAT family N-acetyltransferase [Paludibaculum sp.]